MKTTQLTFTRFIAAFAIVFHHYSANIFPFNVNPLKTIIQHANVGVSYFFLLSGFVLIIAYGNTASLNIKQFYKNRLARIYPLYLLASILIVIFLVVKNTEIGCFELTLNIMMLHAWVPFLATRLNAQTWSISVEIFFYLVFPFLLKYFYSKIKFAKVFLIIISIWFISQLLFNYFLHTSFYKGFLTTSYNFLFFFPLFHINEFLLGNIAGLFFLKYNGEQKNYDGYISALLVLLLIYLSFSEKLSSHDGLLAIIFIPLILLIALNKGRITRLLSSRKLVFLGEMSFGMYLLQNPVFTFSYSILKKIGVTNLTYCFYIRIIILLICSAVCYEYFEKPARNWLKNI